MSLLRRLLAASLTVSLLVVAVWAVVYHRHIVDQVKVWQYRPDPRIVQIAERAGMSQQGRFYFYTTHPQLKTAREFNAECRRIEQASPVLGCYDQGLDAIYIYDVTDPELDGIKEVTAAHEMLHAVYARLSEPDKTHLAQLLEQAYQRVATHALEQRMAYYDRAQPGSRVNELHSILGTEFADIGPELETHYAKYFRDRQGVLQLHQRYSQKFEQAKAQADHLHASLDRQKPILEQSKQQYLADIAAYNQQVEQFNQRARSGAFSSQDAFLMERQQVTRRLTQLQSRRTELEGSIRRYNADVERLNQLGRHIDMLNASLDSTKAVQ